MFTVKDNEIVIGQNFTSNHIWEPNNWQIVCNANLFSSVFMVSNCPKCQIVLGVKLSAVSNCPITENLIGDAFFLSLGNLPMAYEEFYDYQA